MDCMSKAVTRFRSARVPKLGQKKGKNRKTGENNHQKHSSKAVTGSTVPESRYKKEKEKVDKKAHDLHT